jgi:hypothetical protein
LFFVGAEQHLKTPNALPLAALLVNSTLERMPRAPVVRRIIRNHSPGDFKLLVGIPQLRLALVTSLAGSFSAEFIDCRYIAREFVIV